MKEKLTSIGGKSDERQLSCGTELLLLKQIPNWISIRKTNQKFGFEPGTKNTFTHYDE